VETPQPTSAKTLEKVLRTDRGGDLTVADAAAKAGLPLRDAEEGLRWLAAEFGGHLAATEKGEILYSFPNGLERAPETRLLPRIGRTITRAVLGVGRFIVRAWVSVVLVGYALAFLVLLIALSVRSDRDEGPGEAIGLVFRIIAEALFWTFHPFSPVYLRHEPGWMLDLLAVAPNVKGQWLKLARMRSGSAGSTSSGSATSSRSDTGATSW
jgi:hypothetical protein